MGLSISSAAHPANSAKWTEFERFLERTMKITRSVIPKKGVQ